MQNTFVSTASVDSTSYSCLLLKVLMYSLNLMISLISVPSLASISHCYQINFLKFFFFFFFNLFISFRTTAEFSRKHRVPCPPCPRHARLPLHQCTPQWFTCYSQRTSTESVVPSPWFTLGGTSDIGQLMSLDKCVTVLSDRIVSHLSKIPSCSVLFVPPFAQPLRLPIC